MASITLKQIPASLHRALKSRAKLHKRSLTQEMIAALEDSVVSKKEPDVEQLIARADRFRKSLHFVATPEEIDRFKRMGRP